MFRSAMVLFLAMLMIAEAHAQSPEATLKQAEAQYDKCLDASLQHSSSALPFPTPGHLLDQAEFDCRDQLRLYAMSFDKPTDNDALKSRMKQIQDMKEQELLNNHPVLTEFVELMPRAYVRLTLISNNCRPIDRKKVQTYITEIWPFDPRTPMSKRGGLEQLLHTMRDSQLEAQQKELKKKGAAAWCAEQKQLFSSVRATDIFLN